ncbi:MAG TPA: N-acetylmuramidase domain-containing protein [Gemmatimonadales bacterium]
MTTFNAQGDPLSTDAFEHALAIMDIDAATLWAVLHVETRGFGFLPSRRPVITFERQVFHRLTDGRFDADHPELSNPTPGGYIGGAAEYARLNSASTLDASAALQSCSWGIAQLMGFNYQYIGYTSIDQMVEQLVWNEDEQLWSASAFMEEEGLAYSLQEHDWDDFAERYNGSGRGSEGYAAKLAAAHQRFQSQTPDLDVRFVQVALFYLGLHHGPIDGIMEPRTRSALMTFQRRCRLPVTGTVYRGVAEALDAAAFAA